MELGEPAVRTRRRRRCWICVGVVLHLIIVVIVVAVVFGPKAVLHSEGDLRTTFLSRCQPFNGSGCEQIWAAFEQAYVGRDPCEVPMAAYDPLIAAAPFSPACNRMMFWSKTKDLVHDLTKRKDCFVTLEDTLLGFVLDGLTWCGKEGSGETFTTGCPTWTQCENNPVRSFWQRVSAAYADVACGEVSVMLNGSLAAPFSPQSIFGSIEVKRFDAARVKNLVVVLVVQTNSVSTCSNASLKDLQQEVLEKGIRYQCKEVTEAQVHECSNPQKPCGSCW